MDKFEAEYRAKLTPAQFHILREKGTEPPFSGRYYMTNENGIYHCAACHNPVSYTHLTLPTIRLV